MFKLVIARAINSAFLLFIITSDIEQFQSDTLTKVTRMLHVAFVRKVSRNNKGNARHTSPESRSTFQKRNLAIDCIVCRAKNN